MRTVLQSLLMIAVTFAYAAGPYLAVELEHSHEVSQDHCHPHSGDDHGPSHDSHDGGSEPSQEAPQDGQSDTHTHVVSLGADSPVTLASDTIFMHRRIGSHDLAAISESIKDGPSFPLMKPPQLG